VLEPLLLILALIFIPFGLLLAFDRPHQAQRVQRRINLHERTRAALDRLSVSEDHWKIGHLRFELRQNYRALQLARQAADWEAIAPLASPGVLEQWRQEREQRLETGLEWRLDGLEIVDVRPINLQNRPGIENDYVTAEIETRAREYFRSAQGCYQDGTGFVGPDAEHVALQLRKEYWTFVRRPQGWVVTQCSAELPDELVLVDEGEPQLVPA
jgi:hypothetical protein